MRQKLKIEDLQQLAKERGGECLSLEYKNCKSKLLWMCNAGHKWSAIADSVRRGTWCPECAVGRRKQVICLQTGNIYRSIAEAARDIGVSGTMVSRVVLGIRKQTKGLTFKYYNP